VVAEEVSLGGHRAQQVGLPFGVLADDEEGGRHAVAAQDREDFPGVNGMRAVVEGQRELQAGAGQHPGNGGPGRGVGGRGGVRGVGGAGGGRPEQPVEPHQAEGPDGTEERAAGGTVGHSGPGSGTLFI
jgi:hypothetical protein